MMTAQTRLDGAEVTANFLTSIIFYYHSLENTSRKATVRYPDQPERPKNTERRDAPLYTRDASRRRNKLTPAPRIPTLLAFF